MKRGIPQKGTDRITLYTRTYYSLLRTTDAVQIRSLEETHIGMKSSLHTGATKQKPDMDAFIYGSLRLPHCILDTRLILMGQSDEVFHQRGYFNVEAWQPVTAQARRRRMFFNGKDTLAAYIASISDVDDIVPTLTAFQIEWNKMHDLIGLQAGLAQRLHEWATAWKPDAPDDGALMEETRRVLRLSARDWQRLEQAWGEDFPPLLCHLAADRQRMAVSLLAGSHIAYRRATQQWWNQVNRHVDFDLSQRPTYFVSSNTHSLVNMVTGFALRHEERLLAYLESGVDPALSEEAERIRRREVPSNWANFLYYVLRNYLTTQDGADLYAARQTYEVEHGITRVFSQHTFDLEVQVIELGRLNPDHGDPRLQDLPLERLRGSQAVILNIDYPLGFAAYHLLTRLAINVGELRGAYIIGKAATLNGRIGDVLIPNTVYDEHSRNTYLFGNVFTASDVSPYIVYGDVLDNQRAIAVWGTFLQNRAYMEGFLDAGYTDVEMEAGPYLSALYEFIRPRRYPINEIVNLYRVPFEIGVLHYASDAPMSKGKSLGAHNLSYFGMDPTYASTVAVLRRILQLETQEH
ncbi:MAG TPA: hypothetical protein PLH19_03975 [Anaerolineae bacterium]|nr:hypothetical protein [Anaerolineae bacterium]HQH37680.1 hypothetical protein [Anaerolineae bacterium]